MPTCTRCAAAADGPVDMTRRPQAGRPSVLNAAELGADAGADARVSAATAQVRHVHGAAC